MSALGNIIARDSIVQPGLAAPIMAGPVPSALDSIIARDASSGSQRAPLATESRGPDGVLQITMSGSPDPIKGGAPSAAPVSPTAAPPGSQPPAQSSNPVIGAIETLGRYGRGFYQGLSDLPAGVGQSAEHEGLKTLQGIDSLFGTNLAQQAVPNVQAGDAQIAQREADYQTATPGSTAAGLGRISGTLATALPGGVSAMTAPINAGIRLASRALPDMPLLARLLGTSGGSAAQGAAYSSTSPVIAKPMAPSSGNPIGNDYDQQANHNAIVGGLIGAGAPVIGQAIAGAAKYAGNAVRSMIQPFTQEGQQAVAENLLKNSTGGAPVASNTAQLVPGVTPTLAEVTNNPGVATLQRTMRDLHPGPFVEQERAAAAARNDAFQSLAGTPEDIATARQAMNDSVKDLYQQAKFTNLKVDGDLRNILARPSMRTALARAQDLANEQGAGSIFTNTQVRGPMGGAYSSKDAQYVGGAGLHYMKMAIDDMASGRVGAGIGNNEKSALLGTQNDLLEWFEKRAPEYGAAREAYSALAKPITAMEYLQGRNMTDVHGNVTLSKVDGTLKDIAKQQAQAGIQPAKSLTDDQIGKLTALRDDLRRAQAVDAGKSRGSATAQNLATQNLLNQMLPGKASVLLGGMPDGTIPGMIGAGLGYATHGPVGGVVGGTAGRTVGKIGAGLLKTQNEAIQQHLIQMLLNQGDLGSTALNRVPIITPPSEVRAITQRLLYPSLAISSGQAASRPSAH